MTLEKNTVKNPTAQETLEAIQAENAKLKERVEQLLKDKEFELTPRTDNELLRAIYNWKAYIDRTTTELFREKNSEIESLKAEVYRLKKTLCSVFDKEEPPAETEAEKQAFNEKNLYTYLLTHLKQENSVTIELKDYLEYSEVEATEENIAKLKAIAKDLFILSQTNTEENGYTRINSFIQRLEIGKDYLKVVFSEFVYNNL